jgi:hypothetical protein
MDPKQGVYCKQGKLDFEVFQRHSDIEMEVG